MENTSRFYVSVGKWVSAMYEADWYVEQIQEVDESESDVLISFMEKIKSKDSKHKFRWPRVPDEIWADLTSVVSYATFWNRFQLGRGHEHLK